MILEKFTVDEGRENETKELENKEMKKLKDPPSYEEFKKWVQDQGITSQAEFKLAQSKLPSGYPKDPPSFYGQRGTWKGWIEVCGKEPFYLDNAPSYAEFKKWIKKQGIKTSDEFKKFYRTKLPPNYPKDPQAFFTRQGTWKGWGDVIGKEPYRLENPPSYEKFKKWVQKQGIKNQKEFAEFDKSKFPPGYTKNPSRFYKNKGWKGWNDFCGTEQHFLKDPPSYTEFKKWVQKQGIIYKNQFAKLDRKKFPPGYPKDPVKLYQKQGTWRGWGDLFGTGNISVKEKSKLWLPIKEAKIEARKIAKELGIKTRDQWVKAHKDRKIPTNLPRYLHDIYNPKRERT